MTGSSLNPQVREFGVEGKDNGQFSFPNSVVTDSLGNYYVSDGNNGRISAWTMDMQYSTFFGFGSTEESFEVSSRYVDGLRIICMSWMQLDNMYVFTMFRAQNPPSFITLAYMAHWKASSIIRLTSVSMQQDGYTSLTARITVFKFGLTSIRGMQT